MNRLIIAFLSILVAFMLDSQVYGKNNPEKLSPVSQMQETPIIKGEILTLDRCLDIAFKNNPGIGLAKNTTRIYKSKIGQAKSGYLPQINLSSGYGRQNAITKSPIDEASNQYSGSISLNQLIYDFGKTPTKTKIQELNLNSANYDVEDTAVKIAFNVKKAYYSALSAKISRDVYAQSIRQYEKHLKQAKAFFEVGTKSKIDVTTAEVNLNNAKMDYIKGDSDYKRAIASLNNAMGIYNAPEYDVADTLDFNRPEDITDKDIKVSYESNKTGEKPAKQNVLKSGVEHQNIIDDLSFKKFDINLEEAIKTAFENRPDLKSLIEKGTAATESVKLAKKDYFPSLSGYASYGIGGQEFPLDSGWSVGANLNLPVFNGLLTKNQIDEAKASLDIAKSNIEILRQNIYMEVQQAFISLKEAEKRIPVAELIVKQAKEKFDLANGRYGVGVGNAIEVNDAEVSYNNAQLAYVQAFYDYNTAYINLEKAMGVK